METIVSCLVWSLYWMFALAEEHPYIDLTLEILPGVLKRIHGLSQCSDVEAAGEQLKKCFTEALTTAIRSAQQKEKRMYSEYMKDVGLGEIANANYQFKLEAPTTTEQILFDEEFEGQAIPVDRLLGITDEYPDDSTDSFLMQQPLLNQLLNQDPHIDEQPNEGEEDEANRRTTDNKPNWYREDQSISPRPYYYVYPYTVTGQQQTTSVYESEETNDYDDVFSKRSISIETIKDIQRNKTEQPEIKNKSKISRRDYQAYPSAQRPAAVETEQAAKITCSLFLEEPMCISELNERIICGPTVDKRVDEMKEKVFSVWQKWTNAAYRELCSRKKKDMVEDLFELKLFQNDCLMTQFKDSIHCRNNFFISEGERLASCQNLDIYKSCCKRDTDKQMNVRTGGKCTNAELAKLNKIQLKAIYADVYPGCIDSEVEEEKMDDYEREEGNDTKGRGIHYHYDDSTLNAPMSVCNSWYLLYFLLAVFVLDTLSDFVSEL